jgi:hypothetical protein
MKLYGRGAGRKVFMQLFIQTIDSAVNLKMLSIVTHPSFQIDHVRRALQMGHIFTFEKRQFATAGHTALMR